MKPEAPHQRECRERPKVREREREMEVEMQEGAMYACERKARRAGNVRAERMQRM